MFVGRLLLYYSKFMTSVLQ